MNLKKSQAHKASYEKDPTLKGRILETLHSAENRKKAAQSLRKTVEERFEKYAIVEPNSGCWIWSASCDGHGYGQLRVDGKLRFATHLSLEIDGRPRPNPSSCARHKCDTPACVNPDHLEWGTLKENSQDALKRGRLNLVGLELSPTRAK